MKIKTLSFLVTLMGFLVSATPYVMAEVTPIIPNEITLDGISYKDGDSKSRKSLADAFLSVSIPTSMSNNLDGLHFSPLSYEGESDPFYAPDNFKKNYPWLYPFLYEVPNPPSVLAINKWIKPVRISLGLPNDSFAYSDDLVKSELGYAVHHGKQSPAFIKAKELIGQEAKILTPELTALTGLDIQFVEKEPLNDLSSVSNVRIILLDDNGVRGWDDKFKPDMGSYTTGAGENRTWRYMERRLVAAIPFTPLTNRQVDGYFISNEKNEIQFAVCYIWAGHEELMIKKLTQECLVRSLGFTGFNITYNNNHVSVLKPWNGPFPLPPDERIPLAELIKYNASLDELDRFLIKLLYSPEIKPGMAHEEVFNLLIQKDGRK